MSTFSQISEKTVKNFFPLFKFIKEPFLVAVLNPYVKHVKGLKVLDIGCGNSSATILKNYLSIKEYFGIDKTIYNNSEKDLGNIDHFILADLDSYGFQDIPEAHFDLVILSHVIEHLHNYQFLFKNIFASLKTNGLVYIETPSVESVGFPSRIGTLNFYDDSSHIEPVDIIRLKRLSENVGLEIVKFGKRKYYRRILFFPAIIVTAVALRRNVTGPMLWDIYGFSNFAVLKRPR